MKKLAITLLLLSIITHSFSQTPAIQWVAKEIMPPTKKSSWQMIDFIPNDNYAYVLMTNSILGGYDYKYVYKYDLKGNTIGSYYISDGNFNYTTPAHSYISTPDSGLFIIGKTFILNTTAPPFGSSQSGYIKKLNKNVKLEWEINSQNIPLKVTMLEKDAGYCVLDSNSLFRLNTKRDTLWQINLKGFNATDFNYFNDNSIMVWGNIGMRKYDAGRKLIWENKLRNDRIIIKEPDIYLSDNKGIMQINSNNGNINWQYELANINDMKIVGDTNLLATNDKSIIKLTKNGKVEWINTEFGGGRLLAVTDNNGFVIVRGNYIMTKISNNNKFLWQKILSNSYPISKLMTAPDKGLFVIGGDHLLKIASDATPCDYRIGIDSPKLLCYPSSSSTFITLNNEVAPIDNPDFLIRWYKNDVLDTQNEKRNYANINNGGSYTVSVQQGTCSVTSEPIDITVLSNDIKATPQGSTSIFLFEKVTLQAKPVGNFNYQWKKDTTSIKGANSPIFTTNEAGNYFVTISYAGCSVTSSPAIKVSIETPLSTEPIDNQSFISTSPNPTGSKVVLVIHLAQAEIPQLQITDVLGRVIFTQQFTQKQANHSVAIDTHIWALGTYLVKVLAGQQTLSAKLLRGE